MWLQKKNIFKELVMSFRILKLQNWVTKLHVFHFPVNNSKLKNKKFNFELLTRNWKIESSTSS